MKRRNFLTRSLSAGGILAQQWANAAETSKLNSSSSLLQGPPLLAGPDAEHLAILQAVRAPSSGYVEISIDDGPWQQVLPEQNGMVAYEPHVLKFYLPPLQPGAKLRYKVTICAITYQSAYQLTRGKLESSDIYQCQCLDPQKKTTHFVVWNDTHENESTLRALHEKTFALNPDFLLWNGDQTNDVYAAEKMANQYICPVGLPIAANYPLAYLRGNHDVRGPAARLVEKFTHSPSKDFTHAFRSGPVACLTMDTGEDKPDTHKVFQGMVNFDAMRARQTAWLAKIIEEPWFRSAPYKLLFCHIPLWWKQDEPLREYYNCHKLCRDAWQTLLFKAGIQMVISGHTHQAAHLPVTPQRPIAQLVGGGPQIERATITYCVANEKNLTITMSKLDGTVVHKVIIDAA